MFIEYYINFRVGQDGLIRTTTSELNYVSLIAGNLSVPVGFETDLGSIPRHLQILIPKDGKAMFGYVLHDYLYSTLYKGDRDLCDEILKEAMKRLEVKPWRIWCVHVGLKLGGGKAWSDYQSKRRNDGQESNRGR